LTLIISLLTVPVLPVCAADWPDTTEGATPGPATLDATIVTGRRLDAGACRHRATARRFDL
jgi:hypothetical protein